MDKKIEKNGKPLLRRVTENTGSLYVCLPAAFVKQSGIVKGDWVAVSYGTDIIQFKKI